MTNETLARVTHALSAARRETIWSGVAGSKDDYVLTLEIGEKRRRASRLGATELSFNKRTFEGAMGFVIECPWRYENESSVLWTCFDLLEPVNRGPRELPGLEDAAIQEISVTAPAFDLVLALGGNLKIVAFCAEANPKKKRNNWSFWSPQHLVTIAPRGIVSIRDRAAEEAAVREHAHSFESDVVVRLPFGRKSDEPKK
ncbi:MAG: hypothetical protein HYV07_01250 [Deltaproteobacteria bacterium]|nr:hypothetical protein [Deltaproteobacteria bacterium]